MVVSVTGYIHWDLSLCNNWRGITLVPIPSKILCNVILQRIKTQVDKTLRDEQSGFRQERFLRRPDYHSKNNCRGNNRMANFSLHELYNFWKCCDSIRIDHQVQMYCRKFWNTMAYPQKIISIIQQLYDGFSCQVIHDGNLTERAIYCYYRWKTRLYHISSPISDGDRLGQQNNI